MAKAYKVRVIIHTRERSGATHPQRLINRTNHTISPLFCLDAEGTLSMSKQMAKRLNIAKIGHVAIGCPLGPRGMLVSPTKYRYASSPCSSIVRSKGSRELSGHRIEHNTKA
eukprot:scaffold13879_cov142-Isochrysis_galbana.AAC.1